MKIIVITLLFISVHTYSQFNSVYSGNIKPSCAFTTAPGGSNVPLLPLIDWLDNPNATVYHLQLSADASFQIMEIELYGLRKSHYQVKEPLLPYTIYYMRVRGGNDTTYFSFCAMAYFITGAD